MARAKFIAGNWKMYTRRAEAVALAKAVAAGVPSAANSVRVAVCPPFPWLTGVVEAVGASGVEVGAQNCAPDAEGAFTGEVAPGMLADAGCRWVIVGHSERRHGLGEGDALLNKKLHAALTANLGVIFCLGELLAEREAQETEAVLDRQLTAGLAGLDAAKLARVVLAYEPVWAIGTGKVATPEQAQAAHAFIRQKVVALTDPAAAEALLIQYGGSVKADNARSLLHLPDVDGALVGGASLKAESFLGIVAAAG